MGDSVIAPRPAVAGAGNPRPLLLSLVGVAAVTAAVLPFSGADLEGRANFVPVMLALVGVLDLISAVLLVRQFHDSGDRRALVLGSSYVFSLTVLAGYGAAFPGVLAESGPLGGWPSTAPWLWVAWHTGFPVLLAAAVCPWPRRWEDVAPLRVRGVTAGTVVVASVAVGALLVVAGTYGRGWLPEVIDGLNTSAMTRVAGPLMLPLTGVATVAAVVGSMRLAGPVRWASVAAVVAFADVVLTLFSFHRFSLGWYAGRGMTVVASAVVLIAMLGEFGRLRRQLGDEADLLRMTLDRSEELEGLHATLLDHMADGVLLHAEDGRMVAGNRAAFALLGLRPDHVTAPPAGAWEGTLLRPDGSECPLEEAPHMVALATQEPQRDRVVGVRRPDGTQAWLRVNSTFTRPSTTVRGHVVSSMTDETERFEARLLGNEQRAGQRSRVQGLLANPDRVAIVVQPIVDLRTGDVVGGEALSRFSGPVEQGPDVWFAEADEVGLGRDLELVAVRRALDVLDGVPASAYLSVNVSPSTAISRGLLDVFAAAPDAAGRVVLELTEHVGVADYKVLQEALRALRRLGVRVAVDDAGSGFASLRHILQLEPDFVKLDLDLVRNIDRDPARHALAAGLLTFVDQIGAKLIGEGIETESELAALLEVGVHYGQGYHLGRPAPSPLPATVPRFAARR